MEVRLANTCGFVNGVRVGRPDIHVSQPDAHKSRDVYWEPMLIDKDALCLSDGSTTEGTMRRWHSSGSSLSDGEPAKVQVPESSRLGIGLEHQSITTTGQVDDEEHQPASNSERPQIGPLKSLGSALHPLECTECHFYVFNSTGCKAGRDCSYCHELHPRRNPKKNRRYMNKQKETSAAISQEVAASNYTHGRCEDDLTASSLDASASESGDVEDIKYINFSYTEVDPVLGTRTPLILIPGVRVHFPARLQTSTDKYSGLEENVEFTVSPELPPGLTFDKHSGLISGVPSSQQDNSLYRITVSIDVFAPSGIFLGKFPLASSSICIRVVDLQSCMVSSVEDKDREQIALQWL